jgi:DNA polymerase delta subunit 1
VVEDGIDVPGLAGRHIFESFESNVLFVLRFMIDSGVVGGSWVSVKPGKYDVGGSPGRPKLSHCSVDVHLNYRYVQQA